MSVLTHRATCQNSACNVAVGLHPGRPTNTRRDPATFDATAHYVMPGKRSMQAWQALPLLDPTVLWECPCCDALNHGLSTR